jgi:hypothetical protein
VTSSGEDTDINIQHNCDDSGNVGRKQIVKNVSSVKGLGTTEKYSINVQSVILGHMLNVVEGNFRMVLFEECLRKKTQNENVCGV